MSAAASFGPALVALVVLALVALVWARVRPVLVDRRAVAARRARGRRRPSSGPAARRTAGAVVERYNDGRMHA